MTYRYTSCAVAAAVLLSATAVPAVAAPGAGPRVQDPGTTLLPPLPVRLGEGRPCTGASGTTATGAVWSQTTLGLSAAQRVTRGAGVTVAVVGTGVSPDAPALAGRVTVTAGAGDDCVGHGTFAAGLIAAAERKGSGVVGVAPEADVLALRGTDDRGVPDATLVADAIRTAADSGAQVIYVGHTLRTGREELTDAVAHAAGRGALVVAPAAPDAVPDEELGPEGEQPTGPYWPAAAPGALAVVDFGAGGTRQESAPPAWEPDLAAPGSGMVSVGPRGSGHYIGSGASLAAAEVAGAAALVRSRQPGLSGAEVRRRLLATAYPADIPRLDPTAALTLVRDADDRGERSAGAPAARLSDAADPSHRHRALAFTGAVTGFVLLMGWAAMAIPRGRARGWLPPDRPAGRATPPS
ncbi:S8 family serine peptidase [Streptomyces sp. ISL-12]|nr:S8 family serine peptidase [Streptomyces sp. ISL-12]